MYDLKWAVQHRFFVGRGESEEEVRVCGGLVSKITKG
jgi:hypothetical protein